MFWPRLLHKELDNATTDRRMRDFVKSELGDDVRQLNNQVYFRLPGDEDAFDWHQDLAFRQNVQPGIETAYLQTMICIDPMTEENGCLWFAPGFKAPKQHKPARDTPRHVQGERAVTGQPGDLLAWTVTVAHGSRKNTSQQSRMGYMNGFAKAAFCEAWPWYLQDGELAHCDKTLIPYD
jgi:ectoine hydroxylase-related dioxygenase (phytanoyl-CoA dioxygenase family)